VEISVANVGDGILDSKVYVDYITTARVCIRPLDYLPFTTSVVHCYLDVVTATYAFDGNGIHAEVKPNAWLKTCVDVKGASANALHAAAAAVASSGTFSASSYGWLLHNCCHYVDAVLTAAGSPGVTSYFWGYMLW
jgi:hypothetical protein